MSRVQTTILEKNDIRRTVSDDIPGITRVHDRHNKFTSDPATTAAVWPIMIIIIVEHERRAVVK